MTASRGLLFSLLAILASVPAQADQIKVSLFSGTGFFVNHDGYLVTNQHVVNNCQRIVVEGAVPSSEVKLVAVDSNNDLALLKLDQMVYESAPFSNFPHPLRVGDRVLLVGYPGDAFRTATSVTREAQIVSLTGPQQEDKWMMVSNVVEGGDSGGPLFDSAGNVIGVINAHAEMYLYREGQSPESGTKSMAGIAINLPVLEQFLNNQGVRYQLSDTISYLSSERITEMAHRYTVNVRCEYKREQIP